MNDDVTVTLTRAETQALVGMMDAAVKAVGLRAVKDAAAIMVKIERALAAAEERAASIIAKPESGLASIPTGRRRSSLNQESVA